MFLKYFIVLVKYETLKAACY